MKEKPPRSREVRLTDRDFDYGPTPEAVQMCILFVREDLFEKQKDIVFLIDVQKEVSGNHRINQQ